MYRCAECGEPVQVYSGAIERACDCTGPVVAEAQSTLAGRGGVR